MSLSIPTVRSTTKINNNLLAFVSLVVHRLHVITLPSNQLTRLIPSDAIGQSTILPVLALRHSVEVIIVEPVFFFSIMFSCSSCPASTSFVAICGTSPLYNLSL